MTVMGVVRMFLRGINSFLREKLFLFLFPVAWIDYQFRLHEVSSYFKNALSLRSERNGGGAL